MALDFKVIYTGWKNQLNYDSLSDTQKKQIDERSKICLGDPENGVAACDMLTYSPLFKTIESILKVPRKIVTWFAEKAAYERIDDPSGALVEKKQLTTTDEVVGAEGFKCAQCGCAFAASISSPDKHCPLGKW